MRRNFVRGLGVATLGGGVTAYVAYQTDEGTRRMLTAYSQFGPVVLHYRFVELKQKLFPRTEEEDETEWRALDHRYAASTVAKLGELQGMYSKYGQTAAGFTNTFSDTWVQELRKLEDRVPARSIDVVQQTILQETGQPASELFSAFDEVPLGSASIGQVHRATLKDGREVAVKVQYPDSERLFRKDMATIRTFFRVVAPEQLFSLNELEKQNALELDYRNEAASLVEVGENMRRHGFAPAEVVVPQPLSALSTKRMLVMELLPGPKLIDGLRAYGRVMAAKQGRTLEQLEAEMRQRFDEHGAPSKYSGPTARQIAAYLAWLRFWDGVRNIGVSAFNHTIGVPLRRQLEHRHSTMPPNAPLLIDTLMRVHGAQLLLDGVFNAGAAVFFAQ
jgi:aarF domain-containing kinase